MEHRGLLGAAPAQSTAALGGSVQLLAELGQAGLCQRWRCCRRGLPGKAPPPGAPGAAWHLAEASAGCLCSYGAGPGSLVAAGASGYEYLIVIQLWVLAAGGKV